MADLGIGVIGAGYWGQKHVDELSRLKGARLEAVSDLYAPNLEKCRSAFGVKKTYADYKELLADSSIDAVSICTNNEMHYEAAKAALEAGKHALVEKPLTMDAATSSELVALAKRKGLVLCVGHLFRFNAAVRRLRELHQSGFFGKLFFIKVQFTNHNGVVPGRTVLWDLGPHAFDICNFITGRWPMKSILFGSQFRRSELEEVSFVQSDLGDGIYAYGEFSWLLPGKRRMVYLSGEKACAEVDLGSQRLTVHEVIVDEKNREGRIKESRDELVEPGNALADELASFASDCKSGNLQPINSGEVGLRTVEALLSCRKIS